MRWLRNDGASPQDQVQTRSPHARTPLVASAPITARATACVTSCAGDALMSRFALRLVAAKMAAMRWNATELYGTEQRDRAILTLPPHLHPPRSEFNWPGHSLYPHSLRLYERNICSILEPCQSPSRCQESGAARRPAALATSRARSGWTPARHQRV